MKHSAWPLIVMIPLLWGCPGPECSEERPCDAGFICGADARCVAGTATDGGPTQSDGCSDNSNPQFPNVLENPGAESGTEGWYKTLSNVSIGTVTDGAHCGSNALQITAHASGEQHVWNAASVEAGPGETWCAQAFMRGGTATDGRLTVRRMPARIDENYSSPVTTTQWAMVPPTKGLLKFTTAGPETLNLRVTMQFAQAGQTLLVDDVQLWRSPTGSCTER